MVKNWLRQILIAFGFVLIRRTSNQELNLFFRKVRPWNSQYQMVRVGAEKDGGYLVPDIFNSSKGSISACFSPGGGGVFNFEIDLLNQIPGLKVFIIDPSSNRSPQLPEQVSLRRGFLDSIDSDSRVTLDTWVKEALVEGDLILQMDIEGDEYKVIDCTSRETLARFKIVIIEFHYLQLLVNPQGFEFINRTFERLLDMFQIVHVHPNNTFKPYRVGKFVIPPMMEFTFLRKDLIENLTPASKFPHDGDRPNQANLPDYPLPKNWYRF